jgi:hypothetical protein
MFHVNEFILATVQVVTAPYHTWTVLMNFKYQEKSDYLSYSFDSEPHFCNVLYSRLMYQKNNFIQFFSINHATNTIIVNLYNLD